jgi:hypothetical protein
MVEAICFIIFALQAYRRRSVVSRKASRTQPEVSRITDGKESYQIGQTHELRNEQVEEFITK